MLCEVKNVSVRARNSRCDCDQAGGSRVQLAFRGCTGAWHLCAALLSAAPWCVGTTGTRRPRHGRRGRQRRAGAQHRGGKGQRRGGVAAAKLDGSQLLVHLAAASDSCAAQPPQDRCSAS